MASVSIVPWLGAGAFALTLACGACAPSVAAPAGERPTLLIVGEDSDPEAVPRGNRVFTRMLGALADAMIERGFKAYDENAAGISLGARVHRTDAELTTIARSIPQQPVDAVVVVQLHASTARGPSSALEVRARMAGHMILMQTGRSLNNFELVSEAAPLTRTCDRNCVLDNTGDAAQSIAGKLAVVLARQFEQEFPAGAR